MSETVRRIGDLLRSLALLGVGNYGAMAVSLAINALLTRRLGVDAFGRLALMLSVSQAASLLTANWTQSGIVRFGAQEFASTGSVRETFWTRTWVVAPWTALVVLVVLIARDPLATYLTIPTWAVLLLLLHFLAALLLTTVGAMFQARNEMSRYGAMLFLDKAVMAIFLLLMPQSWIGEPARVVGLYAASSIGVAGWGVAVLGRRSFWPAVFDRLAYRRMTAFSLPLILSSWAGLFGTNWFDFVIIKWYRPVSDVGLYSLGTVLAGVVQQITIVFSTWLLPQFSMMVATGEHEQIRRLVDRVFPYWFLATSVMFATVVATASWVVPRRRARSRSSTPFLHW
jgi:O-antigen/teichoic acid export membrane protein